MSRIAELRQNLQTCLEGADQVLNTASQAQRDLTDDERRSFDDLYQKIQSLGADIERYEQLERISALNRGTQQDPTRPELGGGERTASTGFRSFGEQLQAVAYRAMGRPIEQRAATGMNESIGSDGGFLVQSDFSSELLKKTYSTGQVASRVRRIPISANANELVVNTIDESSRVDGSRWGGVQV